MQSIVSVEIVTDVECPLIDVYRRRGGTAGKSGRRPGYQRQQFENRRIGNRRPLRVSRHSNRWQRKTLTLAKPFITKEEKTPVLAVVAERRSAFAKVRQVYGTPNIRAKLIAFERRLS